MSIQLEHRQRAGRALQDQENAVRVVEALVTSAFALRPQDLRQGSRGSATSAFGRQVAMYLTHTRLGLTYTVTGRIFERDRTTAAYACRMVEERREDPRVDAILDRLERAIDGWRAPAGGSMAQA